MEITLQSTQSESLFTGTNDRNQSITLSGNKMAVSPMEAVLMATAGCSSVDVEIILKKMKQPFESITVSVNGHRADSVPAVFTDIHLHFLIKGNVKLEKAVRAVSLSLDKYCSVTQMLAKSVKITHSVEVI